MIDNCYTFKELKEKYNWNTEMGGIDAQCTYALLRGVQIEVAFKKGATYFKIVREINPDDFITWEQIVKKYNWAASSSTNVKDKVTYAHVHGVELELIGKNTTSNLIYLIVKDNTKNTFTWQQLTNKYNWSSNLGTTDKEKYALNKGVQIEYLGNSNRQNYFKLINDFNSYDWKTSSIYPELECCREGYVRNIKTKYIYQGKTSSGYIQVPLQNGKQIVGHRVIMETFCPIENSCDMIVDHIDGIRTHNHIDNLRWVTREENTSFMVQNQTELNKLTTQLLQKYGYEDLKTIYKGLLGGVE